MQIVAIWMRIYSGIVLYMHYCDLFSHKSAFQMIFLHFYVFVGKKSPKIFIPLFKKLFLFKKATEKSPNSKKAKAKEGLVEHFCNKNKVANQGCSVVYRPGCSVVERLWSFGKLSVTKYLSLFSLLHFLVKRECFESNRNILANCIEKNNLEHSFLRGGDTTLKSKVYNQKYIW